MPTHDEFIARFAERLRHETGPAPLTAMLLRTRSTQGRELMAHAATHGAVGDEALVTLARRALDPLERPAAAREAAGFDAVWLASAAKVIALQGSGGTDQLDALGLFELLRELQGAEALDPESAALYAQLLMRLDRMDALREVLPDLDLTDQVRWSLRLDTVNPFIGAGSAEAWLEELNTVFVPAGLEPVTLDGSSATPFDQLSADATSYFDDELVTVVMSAFRPNDSIFTAVRSILAQSWRNLELLIVDDCSGPEYHDLLQRVAALDPRIRLLTTPFNGGTYLVRNLALDEARGEFITFQDFDDWSHPRRLEHQVWTLRATPGALATRCWSVRAFPDLTFTFPGYPPDRVAASSLLFRRRPVVDLIGYFDTVRKSADIEYPSRLKAAAPGSLVDMRTSPPLMIYQIRHDSLSRGDAVPGWLRWTRLAYRDAYTHWHRDVRHGRSSPMSKATPQARAIPLPEASWAGPRVSAPSPVYDVVYVTDWRKGQGTHAAAATEVQLMCDRGLRVGVAHVEMPLPPAPRREPPAASIQELINAGVVDLVHIEQPLEPALVVIGDPGVLQFTPGATSALKADRVVIVAEIPRNGGDDPEVPYLVADCVAHATELFGSRPQWLPRDARTRGYLEARLDDAGDLVEFDLPAAIDPGRFATTRRRPGPGRPVIGRTSTDRPDDWPATRSELLAAYPDDDRFDVRVVGGHSTVLDVLDAPSLPPNWVAFRGSKMATRPFLAQLDFLVHFPREGADVAPPGVVIEAMAAGCVVILPRVFEPAFGDAAQYCAPGEVRQLVRRLHASPEAYHDQQQRALEHVDSLHGPRACGDRLARLVGLGQDAGDRALR
ncbi:MAG TPA: glycosyltransferase [Jiangellaceae bacterium]